MDTRHLRAALAVREHGSFTTAAEKLFLAQSSLSRQVGVLERQVGAELFLRGPRRTVATPVGERFLVEAEAVLSAVDRAERVVRDRARASTTPPGARSRAGQ